MTEYLPGYMTKGAKRRGCSIDGCPGKHIAQGYCGRHYSRLVRHRGRRAESPGDYNIRYKEPLSEHEFVLFKDFRQSGFSMTDTAFELQKHVGIIRTAWEFACYGEYIRGKKYEDEMV